MTALTEEKCRELLRKLVRNCGWHVRVWTPEKNGFARKCVSSKNWFLTWDGDTWADVWRKLLMDLEYARTGPVVDSDPSPRWFVDALPAWMVGCGSEEELVLRAEVLP